VFGGALTHPKILGLEGQKRLRSSIESLHKGPDKAHRFLILEEGMSYAPFGVDPIDAQLIEQRRFQIAEVARYFKIPVGLLGDLERSTFSNQEQQVLSYVTQCLRGWLVKIEQELAVKLFTRQDRKQFVIEHELSGLLRGDTAGRAE
jgi:HK97 family phage portal protein